MKLYPPTTLPSGPHPKRSGWLKSTPVSITAIFTPSPFIPFSIGVSVPTKGPLLSRYKSNSSSKSNNSQRITEEEIRTIIEKITLNFTNFLVFFSK